MQPTSRRIEVSDGLSLHALEWSTEGVPMILIHGFGNEAHIWDDFAPRVAEHYRVIAISLRGHGDSDWDPERRYDYTDHLADLEAITTQLGIERMVLVGHSLGGRVAMLYAGRHPEQLAGLGDARAPHLEGFAREPRALLQARAHPDQPLVGRLRRPVGHRAPQKNLAKTDRSEGERIPVPPPCVNGCDAPATAAS